MPSFYRVLRTSAKRQLQLKVPAVVFGQEISEAPEKVQSGKSNIPAFRQREGVCVDLCS